MLHGAEGLVQLVVESGADLVLNALVGSAGLGPTVATLGEGIDLALANKESLVVGGELVTALAEATGARIVPVDSEHTALHQLLAGQPPGAVERLTITASGGPFRGRTSAQLQDVSVADALAHPTWAMGSMNTIGSATLMNKGLELMEAHHLFGTPYERIDVVVHPQSLIHGLIQLADGAMLAHLGPRDMRVAISYALHGGESVALSTASGDGGGGGESITNRSHRSTSWRSVSLPSRPLTSRPSPACASRVKPQRKAAPPRACSTPPTRSPFTPFSPSVCPSPASPL